MNHYVFARGICFDKEPFLLYASSSTVQFIQLEGRYYYTIVDQDVRVQENGGFVFRASGSERVRWYDGARLSLLLDLPKSNTYSFSAVHPCFVFSCH